MGDYTPEGLPVLTENILTTDYRDLAVRSGEELGKYIFAAFEHIGATNPLVKEFMLRATLRFPGEYRAKFLSSLIALYEFLRRQAEANQLEKMLEQSP